MKFIRANIDAATHDAQIAIQIEASGCERIQAGIDAGRVGLQPQIPGSHVHEQRRVGPTVIQGAGGMIVRAVGINNAVVQRAASRPAAEVCPVASHGTVIQRAPKSTAARRIVRAKSRSPVAAQGAIVQRAAIRPAAETTLSKRIAVSRVATQCSDSEWQALRSTQ